MFKIFKKNKLKNDKKFTENLTEKREEVQVIPAVPITPVIQRINLQQWLDENYPKDQRDNIRELDVSDQWENENTTKSLKLEGFINLEKLNCSNNGLTSLDLSDCWELWNLNCENNQLKNLNLINCFNLQYLLCSNNQLVRLNLTNYHKLEKLEFNNNQLVNLNLSNLSNLNNLFFTNNQLVDINIDNCPRIREIDFSNNSLVRAKNLLGNLNNDKLETLNISNNNFSRQDLSCFSKFVNLRSLIISNNDRFYGSLEPLQNLGGLEVLKIDNTDVNLGLEYLPNSIREFSCASLRIGRKVKSFQKELASFILLVRDKSQIEFKVNRLVEEQRKFNKEHYDKHMKIYYSSNGFGWERGYDVLSKVYANKREYELSESNARQKNLAEAQKYNKDENYYTNLKNNYYAQEKSQKEAIVSFSGQDIQGWKNINSDKLMKLKRKENALTAYSSSVALAVDEKEIENLTDNQIIQQLKERNRQLWGELEESKRLITSQKEKILELEVKLGGLELEKQIEFPPCGMPSSSK